jgi:hypothetical protein
MTVLAYGIPADYANEYLHIGEDTTMDSVRRFCKVMIGQHIFELQMSKIYQGCWVRMRQEVGREFLVV